MQVEQPQQSNDIQLSKELFQMYGLSNQQEIEALDTLLRHSHKYGNNDLRNGLSNMFRGMEHAVKVYSEMKNEIHSLHDGILVMRNEASEAKDQLLIAETMARQRLEVTPSLKFLIAPSFNTSTHTGTIQHSHCQL